ncbi:MAG TPA: mechanosensitive ion channel family protein, partial [Candidatus Lustribacter sp.]|nr:mechanosensitive ion channel family protein [Candidatus Lustribacter sp.]
MLTQLWDRIVGTPLTILAIALGAVLLRWLVHRLIARVVQASLSRSDGRRTAFPRRTGRVFAEATGMVHERHVQRASTMGSILRSITTASVYAVALLTVMDLLGIPLAPLLASAGVGGVALGFGAQSLVKDFLSGIFMIVEDQYGVGDVIDTGEAIGTVEEVSLRVTRLRDGAGVIWYVRNGEIVRVANRSQGWSTATVDIPVAYGEDLEKVLALLRSVVARLDGDDAWTDKLIDPPEVMGVESMAGGVVTIRIVAKCPPNEPFGVQREIRERVKAAFDAAGISGPAFPPGV